MRSNRDSRINQSIRRTTPKAVDSPCSEAAWILSNQALITAYNNSLNSSSKSSHNNNKLSSNLRIHKISSKCNNSILKLRLSHNSLKIRLINRWIAKINKINNSKIKTNILQPGRQLTKPMKFKHCLTRLVLEIKANLKHRTWCNSNSNSKKYSSKGVRQISHSRWECKERSLATGMSVWEGKAITKPE